MKSMQPKPQRRWHKEKPNPCTTSRRVFRAVAPSSPNTLHQPVFRAGLPRPPLTAPLGTHAHIDGTRPVLHTTNHQSKPTCSLQQLIFISVSEQQQERQARGHANEKEEEEEQKVHKPCAKQALLTISNHNPCCPLFKPIFKQCTLHTHPTCAI